MYSSNLFDIKPKKTTVPKKSGEYEDKEIKGNLLFHKGLLLLIYERKWKSEKCFKEGEIYFKAVLLLNHGVFKAIKQVLKEKKII